MRRPKQPTGIGYYHYAMEVVKNGEVQVDRRDEKGVLNFLKRTGWNATSYPSIQDENYVLIVAERMEGR